MSARHRRRKRLEASPDYDPAKTVTGRKIAKAYDEMVAAAERVADAAGREGDDLRRSAP